MIKSLFENDNEDIKARKAAENKAENENIEEIAKAIETGNIKFAEENNITENIENPSEKPIIKEAQPIETATEIRQIELIPTFQITEPAFEDNADDETLSDFTDYEAELEATINQISAQPSSVRKNESPINTGAPFENAEDFSNRANEPEIEFVSTKKENHAPSEPTFQFETQSETVRRTGLAFSAAITLFGAVAFMMIIGWFFDLICGTSPWGIVGGVAFGALIGFIQFFRQTSQIFKKNS